MIAKTSKLFAASVVLAVVCVAAPFVRGKGHACTGDADCRVCSNCRSCGYCKSHDDKCGVFHKDTKPPATSPTAAVAVGGDRCCD